MNRTRQEGKSAGATKCRGGPVSLQGRERLRCHKCAWVAQAHTAYHPARWKACGGGYGCPGGWCPPLPGGPGAGAMDMYGLPGICMTGCACIMTGLAWYIPLGGIPLGGIPFGGAIPLGGMLFGGGGGPIIPRPRPAPTGWGGGPAGCICAGYI